jgi:hypothetical protein
MTCLKIATGENSGDTMAADVRVQDAAVAEYLARKEDVSAQLRQHGMRVQPHALCPHSQWTPVCCFKFSRVPYPHAAACPPWPQHSARLRPSMRRCRAVRRYVPYVCASHANERARLTLQCLFRTEEL